MISSVLFAAPSCGLADVAPTGTNGRCAPADILEMDKDEDVSALALVSDQLTVTYLGANRQGLAERSG